MNRETLRAVVDCLVPPDDFPGAYEAGVCDFLERLLQTDLAERADFFDKGLEAIEAEALATFAQPFAQLAPEQQTALLRSVETAGVKTHWSIDAARFFEMLVHATVEGYYSDPEQGGNRGEISWVMIGFAETAG